MTVSELRGNGKLDISTLENWLWNVSSKLRGPIEASKYKDYILPLIFLKRLSDVFEDEVQDVCAKFNKTKQEILALIDKKRDKYVSFYIPKIARWDSIVKVSTNVGEYLTNAIREVARYNSKLDGVINIVDYNATVAGQRILDDGSLKGIINELSKYRLGLKDVEPDILGRAYEYLLRKFAEGSGQSAGEFYTPKEVSLLMAYLLDPEPGHEIYDPTCGSGGLLLKVHLVFKEKYKGKVVAPIRLYGQEINNTTYALAKMNMFLHGIETADIRIGNTMLNPQFLNGHRLKQFDLITANPMWNQDFDESIYSNDPYDRFIFGIPPSNSADWGWIQHMYSSLKDKGKMAVVLDTGAVSRGSGSNTKNRERDIRKAFVENDLIEAVILLPENLFYNTTAPGVIVVINKNKSDVAKGKILLINASQLYEKGRPKNFLTDEAISKIKDCYFNFNDTEISKVITLQQASENDYNLSPSRYVSLNNDVEAYDFNE
ncbi:MAG: type I restriction-modification system subunit M, partial [Thermodesulfovibrio sp.]|nr:type I restriction-modification system subunit M [Thermodesulfovibrio sp.]